MDRTAQELGRNLLLARNFLCRQTARDGSGRSRICGSAPSSFFCLKDKVAARVFADIFFIGAESALKHLFGKLILDTLLDGAPERPCPVYGVEALLAYLADGALGKFHLEVKLGDTL